MLREGIIDSHALRWHEPEERVHERRFPPVGDVEKELRLGISLQHAGLQVPDRRRCY